MVPYYLFCPYHIVPPAELISAFVELSDAFIAHVPVEAYAVPVKVLVIFFLRHCYAGIEICDSHSAEDVLQLCVQELSYAAVLVILIGVDSELRRPVIGSAAVVEGPSTGIAYGDTLSFRNDKGVLFKGIADALPELLL